MIAPGMEVKLEGGRRVSLGTNDGARNGREIALVGVANVVDQKAEDRREVQRWRAKDG